MSSAVRTISRDRLASTTIASVSPESDDLTELTTSCDGGPKSRRHRWRCWRPAVGARLCWQPAPADPYLLAAMLLPAPVRWQHRGCAGGLLLTTARCAAHVHSKETLFGTKRLVFWVTGGHARTGWFGRDRVAMAA
jgi:hypothetical protein